MSIAPSLKLHSFGFLFTIVCIGERGEGFEYRWEYRWDLRFQYKAKLLDSTIFLEIFKNYFFLLITHFSLKENEESFETFYLSI
jgi:hypothetical protein